MKQRIRNLLDNDEKVLVSIRKTPTTLVLEIIWVSILLALGLWLIFGANAYKAGIPNFTSEFGKFIYDLLTAINTSIWLILAVCVFFVGVPLFRVIRKAYSYVNEDVVITNKKAIVVMRTSSFTNIRTAEIELKNLMSIDVMQGFWGNIFNYASLIVKTNGGSLLDQYIVDFVKDAELAKKKIVEILKEHKNEESEKEEVETDTIK